MTLTLTFLAVYLMVLTAILFRPGGTDWAVWAPYSGLAVAVIARFPRRDHWRIAVLLALAVGAASYTARGEPLLAVGGFVALALGAWLGSLVLRGTTGRAPRLDTVADLARLFSCAGVTASVTSLAGTGFVAAALGPEAVVSAFVTSLLCQAVGVLLAAPLIIGWRRQRGSAGPVERMLAWLALVGTIVLVFAVNAGLPLASVVIVPLTWAAARLAPRSAMLMLTLTAASVAFFSPLGRGPYAAAGLDPHSIVTMVQVFDFSIGIAFLTLIAFVGHQRRLTEAVRSSEVLFRTAFDSALVGTAIVRKTVRGPVIEQLNSAARTIARIPDGRMPPLRSALTREGFQSLVEVVGRFDEPGADEWRGTITVTTGRVLDVLLSRMASDLDGNAYTIQFLDVTERVQAEVVERAEMTRAAEVQRALLPKDADPLPGYEVAGDSMPATSVGGDFYDWYPTAGGMALSLCDVMGKGVGAGMIATTIRAVLRSARRDPRVSAAVVRASETLETQVADAHSFATLFHGRVSADDGTLRFVDAGHGLAVILRADGTDQTIGSLDMPLGVMPGAAWTERTETLHPGDMLVVVSDGVLELYDGSLDALDRIVDLARRSGTAEATVAAVTDLVTHDGAPDDITVLAVRRRRADEQPVIVAG